ncbi:hypothetical protein OAP94_00510 [bacterium]|jgi:hypothetical protein|nr:hypothetical protein [bacterium]MDC1007144.1 hypothetical protein [bacterium]
MEDDIHDQLTKAYLEYFKENENFENRVSYRTHRASRKWLREIRRLSKLRMEEIHTTFGTKLEAKKD